MNLILIAFKILSFLNNLFDLMNSRNMNAHAFTKSLFEGNFAENIFPGGYVCVFIKSQIRRKEYIILMK